MSGDTQPRQSVAGPDDCVKMTRVCKMSSGPLKIVASSGPSATESSASWPIESVPFQFPSVSLVPVATRCHTLPHAATRCHTLIGRHDHLGCWIVVGRDYCVKMTRVCKMSSGPLKIVAPSGPTATESSASWPIESVPFQFPRVSLVPVGARWCTLPHAESVVTITSAAGSCLGPTTA